jgi:hypothetical protein
MGIVNMAFRLVLLDRNAVIAVKKSVSGQIVETQRLSELRKLDKQRNFISPILSMIEGQSGRRESTLELESTLEKESEAIGSFFKRARTDTAFFKSTENSRAFSDIFSNHIEHAWDCYISFIKDVQIHLYQPVSPIERLNVENRLFALAKEHGVQVLHPVLLVALAVLYGHKGARKVIKPKPNYKTTDLEQQAAYNVVSDLIVISRIGQIRLVMSKGERNYSYVKFFTFDKGLSSVINAIKINSEEYLSEEYLSFGVGINVSCNRSLFPYLDDQNWYRLQNALGIA